MHADKLADKEKEDQHAKKLEDFFMVDIIIHTAKPSYSETWIQSSFNHTK